MERRGYHHNPEAHEGHERNLQLLQETIAASAEVKTRRREHFEQIWENRFVTHAGRRVFQVHPDESPFSEYSSKGWKIHIAVPKGEEKDIARFLFENGLYFKVEIGAGTYFYGHKESGATIYIGSFHNTNQIAEIITEQFGDTLSDGAHVQLESGKIVHLGSGSDIEIKPRVTARFDIGKTEYGHIRGNGKYADYALPTQLGLAGIPLLEKYRVEAERVLSNWNDYLPNQRQIYFDRFLKPAYEESWRELVKDFGEDFLIGTNNKKD